MSYSPASTSSAASTSSRIHPASLVDVSHHSPSVLELVETKVSRQVIDYLVEQTAETVDFALGRPHERGRSLTKQYQSFTSFVNTVITRAEVTMPTILATLVYIDRARPHISIALEEWAHERVFLGALMVASKYLNDSTLKNVHWSICTGVFGKRDVGRVEREYLDVLDFQLGISDQDLMAHYEGLSAVVLPPKSPYYPYPCRDVIPAAHHAAPEDFAYPYDMPELDMSSSPDSSSSMRSMSPLTPPSPVPQTRPRTHHRYGQPTKAAPVVRQTTLDLLRSFPVPSNTRSRPLRTAVPPRRAARIHA
ncbi:uncharacterized protein SCHCODRAFT_02662127 [Schizophyllum commune H4-8]|uniref:Cyclin N-terminal domain-containing protein n=1 Tax=Schizophyllum commune (strain H4-8 / FGSC 9210) TaxID=578458 RepID=D8PUS7_SCHCM|nr:uncharacterized protein SCHCODRAFT_02662127 [Schizophyllum commune H4-8]KAI5900635.1 hypothetical protein SCHCODRAFT_02662127 [Schizophyllum commune H4-8]